jgi:UDP-GlcNAc:undecaprenyl-phosphate GlcNAc-1-phosphate transferase
MTSLYATLLSFGICLAATPLVRAFAHRAGWIDRPKADRWHKKPTALMGGIAIFAGVAASLFWTTDLTIAALFTPLHISSFAPSSPQHAHFTGTVLLLGICLVFVLGLVDDLLHIKPQTKLLGQILVASIVTYYGFRLNWTSSLTLDTMLTLVWIVGITNALNLLDNMDGLCAGVAFVAAFVLGLLLMGIEPHLALYAFVLCGALGAFLIFNFNPASIFMGDSGSLVIGFYLSFLALAYSGLAAPPAGDFARMAVVVLVMMVPIFDTTLVTTIRLLSGRRASVGGKDHTSHRLVLIGLSEKRAMLFLCGVGAFSGLSAWFVSSSDSFTSPAVIVPVAVSVLLFGIYLAQLRVYPEKEFGVLRDKTFTPVLMELTHKRQLLLVSLDFGLIAFSYYLSYRLRFSGGQFALHFGVFLQSLPAIIACKLAAYFLMGVYRGIWSFLSFNDIWVYIKASVLGSLLSVAVVTYLYRFEDFSKGIFFIDWMIATAFLLGTRGSFRLFRDVMGRGGISGEKVILYGAGRGGEILLREVVNNRSLGIKPVAMVDDDPLKAGKRLQGLTVHPAEQMQALAEKTGAVGIVLTFREANPGAMERARQICRSQGLFLRRLCVKLDEVELSRRAEAKGPAK